MGLVPTVRSVIGTFINGRNAKDDFLQLADNHGGTIFGWIDSDGVRQGSLAGGVTSLNGLTGVLNLVAGTNVSLVPSGTNITINSTGGTPGGANTDVQINDSNAFYGDSGFTYNKTIHSVNITSTDATGVGILNIANNNFNSIGSTSLVNLTMDGASTEYIQLSKTSPSATANILMDANSTISLNSLNGAGVLNVGTNFINYVTGSATGEFRVRSNAGQQLIFDFNTGILTTPIITFPGSTSGTASISVAAAAGTPNKILLPITTGTAGQVLTTDGANPQQTSWTTVSGGGGITGSISAGQIAVGSGVDTIGGSSSLTFSGGTFTVDATDGIALQNTTAGTVSIQDSAGAINIDETAASGTISIQSSGSGGISFLQQTNSGEIQFNNTSGGGFYVTAVGGGVYIQNSGSDNSGSGWADASGGGITINTTVLPGNITIDATGTGALLQLNPSGLPVVLNGTTLATPPATATSAGTTGTILWATVSGTSYIYAAVATNTWRRVALATF
jgi:hypothetical protein